MDAKTTSCPCGYTEITARPAGTRQARPSTNSGRKYADCCGRYLDDGETAPTAEALMRSRYTAYALGREEYLLATWSQDTRPASLGLESKQHGKWLRLEVKLHEQSAPDHAMVEFVARYKVDGRAHRLHEISRFVREGGQWFYVVGDIIRS